MTFSWAQAKEDAITNQIRRQRLQAKKKSPDFVIKHSDESRDSEQKNYIKLDKRVRTELLKHQAKALERRNKRL